MWADYCTIDLYLCFLILQSRLTLVAFWGQPIGIKKALLVSAPQNKPNKITAEYHFEAVFLFLNLSHLSQVSKWPQTLWIMMK